MRKFCMTLQDRFQPHRTSILRHIVDQSWVPEASYQRPVSATGSTFTTKTTKSCGKPQEAYRPRHNLSKHNPSGGGGGTAWMGVPHLVLDGGGGLNAVLARGVPCPGVPPPEGTWNQ